MQSPHINNQSNRWLWILFGVAGFLVITSMVLKMIARPVNDFSAYYFAGEQLLNLKSPYVERVAYDFKYPPFVALFFIPIALIPYAIAKWLFGVLQLALVAMSFRVLKAVAPSERHFLVGSLLGFLAAFRFLDAQFSENQVGTTTAALVLLGFWGLWQHSADDKKAASVLKRFAFGIMVVLGGLFKVHGVLVGIMLLKVRRLWSRLELWLAVVVGVLLPWPGLWRDMISSLSRSTPGYYLAGGGIFQGLKPTVDRLVGSAPLVYVMASALIVALMFVSLPKLKAKDSFALVALQALVLVLLGVFLSPLPWQHTYSVLIIFLPLLWFALAGPGERRVFVVLVLLFGFSARGVAGNMVSTMLETYNFIGFLVAITLVFTVIILRRRVGALNMKPRA